MQGKECRGRGGEEKSDKSDRQEIERVVMRRWRIERRKGMRTSEQMQAALRGSALRILCDDWCMEGRTGQRRWHEGTYD